MQSNPQMMSQVMSQMSQLGGAMPGGFPPFPPFGAATAPGGQPPAAQPPSSAAQPPSSAAQPPSGGAAATDDEEEAMLQEAIRLSLAQDSQRSNPKPDDQPPDIEDPPLD